MLVFLFFVIHKLYSATYIEYGPYINSIDETFIGLRYTFSKPVESWLTWGEAPQCKRYLTYFPPQKNVSTFLYGISPGKNYCYNVYLPIENSTYSYIASSGSFYSLFSSSTSIFNFILFVENSTSDIISLLDLNITTNTQFVVYFPTSDISMIPDTNIPRYFDIYSKFIKDIPFICPLTEFVYNFETKTIDNNYLKFFTFDPSNGFSPYYYHLDIANTRIIFIDLIASLNHPKIFKEQINYLKKVLSNTSKIYNIIVLNQRIYPEIEINKNLSVITKLLSDSKVSLVIQYSNYPYERGIFLESNYDNTVYITLGYPSGFEGGLNAEFSSNENGILKIDIAHSIDIQYINYSNKIIDRITIK